jgi:hypothetical protein
MKPTARRPIASRFAPLGPAPRNERPQDTISEAPAAPLPGIARLVETRACPASRSVLVRTAALLAIAAGVILALPPLSKGDSPTRQTATLGIVSPSAEISPQLEAAAARRDPRPQPAMHEGRLAALSGPTYTGSVAKAHDLPRPVTVDTVDVGPLAFAGPSSAQAHPLPAPFAALAAAPASSAPAAAMPLPRPPGLAAPASTRAAATPKGEDTASLVTEARRQIARGQLAAGRATLKHAVAAGSSHAATILAKTYDPAVLKSWHVKGAKVDPAEARQWYEKAKALGSPGAKDALARLQ